MIKRLLKAILPVGMRRTIRRFEAIIFGMEREYKDKSNSEIFDKIYSQGVWGKTEDGIYTSGSGSHSAKVIGPYIDVVKNFISDIRPKVIVDIGCGDFNVGKNFAEDAEKYVAFDVSSVILQRNKEKYSSLENVEFLKLDLATDELPRGDVAFVRQVLQHLSNDDIKLFVDKINYNKPFKFLIVTEHLPGNKSFKPNINKPAGPNIRNDINSGIILHEAPFGLQNKNYSELLEVSEDVGAIKSVIRSTLYEF